MTTTKNVKETKALQIFQGSVRTLKLHMQLLDCSLSYIKKTIPTEIEGGTVSGFFNCQQDTHPQLDIPCTTKEINRIIAASKSKNNEQAMIEIYRHFSNYIKNLIIEFANKDHENFLKRIPINKDDVVSFEQIIKCKNRDELINLMGNMIFRRFENERSTAKLLNKIISYVKIDVDKTLIKKALIYLEIRHLIIHNNSTADANFVKNAESINISVKQGVKIPMNFVLVKSAIDAISTLCETIDKELIDKKFVSQRN